MATNETAAEIAAQVSTAQAAPANGRRTVASRYTNPKRTIDLMAGIVREDKLNVFGFAWEFWQGGVEETCQVIWHWLRKNVFYRDDHANYIAEGYEHPQEWLRRPQRTIAEAEGDCDCATILVAAILENLGIDYAFRMVAWNPDEDGKPAWAHIYPVAFTDDGQEIIIDFIPEVPSFNYQLPYYEVIDTHFISDSNMKKKRGGETLILSGKPSLLAGQLLKGANILKGVIIAKTREEFFRGLGINIGDYNEVVEKRIFLNGMAQVVLDKVETFLKANITAAGVQQEIQVLQNIRETWDGNPLLAIEHAKLNAADSRMKKIYVGLRGLYNQIDRMPNGEMGKVGDIMPYKNSSGTLGFFSFVKDVFDGLGDLTGIRYNNVMTGVSATLASAAGGGNPAVSQAPQAAQTGQVNNQAAAAQAAALAAEKKKAEEAEKEAEKQKKMLKYGAIGFAGVVVIALLIWALTRKPKGSNLSGKKRKRKKATTKKTTTRNLNGAVPPPKKVTTRQISGAKKKGTANKPAAKKKAATTKKTTAKKGTTARKRA